MVTPETLSNSNVPSPADPAVRKADRIAKLRRFLRYIAVSIIALGLDVGVFLSLTDVTGWPTISSIAAYACGIVLNFELSKRWVFDISNSDKGRTRLFAEFLATGLLGLVITASVTYVTVHWLAFSPVSAKTTAVLTCFLILYIVRSQLVFSGKSPDNAGPPIA